MTPQNIKNSISKLGKESLFEILHVMGSQLKEFYKDKFILNLFLKLYFLPYNTLKYLSYLCDRHKFQMIENEIEMLKKARGNEDEQS